MCRQQHAPIASVSSTSSFSAYPVAIIAFWSGWSLSIARYRHARYIFRRNNDLRFFWYRVTKSWGLSCCFTLLYPLAFRAIMYNAAITDRISVFVVFAAMALWIFVPAVIYCWQNKLSHIGYLGASAFIFTLAMVCRQVDMDVKVFFERGSHFLWHILGVLATHILMTYVYINDSEIYDSRRSK